VGLSDGDWKCGVFSLLTRADSDLHLRVIV